MSERGSFVTEYVYCGNCFEVLKKHLLADQDKWLYGHVIPGHPIIAGKIGHTFSAGEVITFMSDYGNEIVKELCHPVRLMVICESVNWETLFILDPLGVFEKPVAIAPNGEWDGKKTQIHKRTDREREVVSAVLDNIIDETDEI